MKRSTLNVEGLIPPQNFSMSTKVNGGLCILRSTGTCHTHTSSSNYQQMTNIAIYLEKKTDLFAHIKEIFFRTDKAQTKNIEEWIISLLWLLGIEILCRAIFVIPGSLMAAVQVGQQHGHVDNWPKLRGILYQSSHCNWLWLTSKMADNIIAKISKFPRALQILSFLMFTLIKPNMGYIWPHVNKNMSVDMEKHFQPKTDFKPIK